MCLSLKLPSTFCFSYVFYFLFFPSLFKICLCVCLIMFPPLFVQKYLLFHYCLRISQEITTYILHNLCLIFMFTRSLPGQYKHLRKIEIRSFSPQISLQSYLTIVVFRHDSTIRVRYNIFAVIMAIRVIRAAMPASALENGRFSTSNSTNTNKVILFSFREK